MRIQKVMAWIMASALFMQGIPASQVYAETISVTAEDSVQAVEQSEEEPEEIQSEEIEPEVSVSGLSVSGDTPVSALDGAEFTPSLGHVPAALRPVNPKNFEGLTGADLPSEYMSPYITPVRDQTKFGTCWAFAATGAIEASMVKFHGADKNTLDLSDVATAYFGRMGSYDEGGRFATDSMSYKQSDSVLQSIVSEYKTYYDNVEGRKMQQNLGYLQNGGNSFQSMVGLAHWNGLIPESEAPYPLGDTNSDYSKATEVTNSLAADGKDDKRVAVLKDAMYLDMEGSENLVKQMLMEYGAGDVSYYAYVGVEQAKYFNEEKGCYYQDQKSATNHEVLLVGWDDTYPKENFKESCRPQNDGAWIIKNSWGTGWGGNDNELPDGYFYLSYEDKGVLSSDVNFYTVDTDLARYDHNYQYDGTNMFLWYDSEAHSNGFYSANVYEVNNKKADEKLHAVGVFTGPDTQYEIEIYKNPEKENGAVKDPRTGTLIGKTSGQETFMGYHMISVSCNEVLKDQDTYSVVVYQKTNQKDQLFVDADYTVNQSTYTVEANGSGKLYVNYFGSYAADASETKGQSFTTYFSDDTSNWTDLETKNCTARIKGFTADVCSLRVSENEVRLLPGDNYYQPVEVVTGELVGSLTYESSDPSVATVDETGKVTAVSIGTTVITAYAPDGAIVSYKVNVCIPMAECTVSPIGVQQYTGEEIIPYVKVSYKGEELIQDTDYTVSGQNNIEKGTAQATITGIGRYKGTQKVPFEIKDIGLSVSIEQKDFVYTGKEIKPALKVEKSGKELKEGSDYSAKFKNNVNAGKAYIIVTLLEDSTSITKSFTIQPADVSKVTFGKIPQQTLSDNKAEPKVEVSFDGAPLRKDVDYTVSYVNNTAPAVAIGCEEDPQAVVTMKRNFTGEKRIPFTIIDKSEGEIDISKATVSNLVSAVYTGRPVIQQPTVILNDKKAKTKTLLTEGKDYYLTYEGKDGEGDNVNAGIVTVTINGCGEYTGSIEKKFTIKSASVASPEFTVRLKNQDHAYKTQDGSEIKPEVEFVLADGQAVPTSDYTVSYKSNKKAGVGKVTVKAVAKKRGGSGNFTGSKTLCFAIGNEVVELENLTEKQVFTGAAIKPKVTSLKGTDGSTYPIGKEWKIAYYDNKNAGEALIILTGKGENKGKAGVCHFTIEKQKAENLTVTPVNPQKFKGKALRPAVTIKNGKRKLKAGTDYNAYYYDNTKIGEGRIVLKFHGNYEGQKTITFDIK